MELRPPKGARARAKKICSGLDIFFRETETAQISCNHHDDQTTTNCAPSVSAKTLSTQQNIFRVYTGNILSIKNRAALQNSSLQFNINRIKQKCPLQRIELRIEKSNTTNSQRRKSRPTKTSKQQVTLLTCKNTAPRQ